MLRTRVMPCLLLRNRGLVKTTGFKNPRYVGDPINTVRIFNEKEVDELIFLDITATVERRKPQFDLLEDIASECFMPVAYGGGVRELADMQTLFGLGVEKIAINSFTAEDLTFLRRAADQFGSQSVIGSMDVKRKRLGGYEVLTHGGRQRTRLDPVRYATQLATHGTGEILLTSIDRDGTMAGYDLELLRQVTNAVNIPVIACGGAGELADLGRAVHEGDAAAVAAGSLFVYQGKQRGVLINFPTKAELRLVLEH